MTVMGAMTGAFFCSAAFTSAAEMLAEISVLPFASVLTVPTEPFAVVVVSVTAPVALSVVVVVVEPSGVLGRGGGTVVIVVRGHGNIDQLGDVLRLGRIAVSGAGVGHRADLSVGGIGGDNTSVPCMSSNSVGISSFVVFSAITIRNKAGILTFSGAILRIELDVSAASNSDACSAVLIICITAVQKKVITILNSICIQLLNGERAIFDGQLTFDDIHNADVADILAVFNGALCGCITKIDSITVVFI